MSGLVKYTAKVEITKKDKEYHVVYLAAEVEAVLKVRDEILAIMKVYHEQEASSFGVDTPGGLEHMGDVWNLFLKWERLLTKLEVKP